MRYDETEFPSVADIEDDFGKELPEADEEWLEYWDRATYPGWFWDTLLDTLKHSLKAA